jgi:hypothetical protein
MLNEIKRVNKKFVQTFSFREKAILLSELVGILFILFALGAILIAIQ